MRVCNVCFGLPKFNGNPCLDLIEDSRSDQYLFGQDYESGEMDLCQDCLDLFQTQSWDKIAVRSKEVLMLRLGVKEKEAQDVVPPKSSSRSH